MKKITNNKDSWSKLLCSDREESSNPKYGRSEFETDYDRIVFSFSFRRLADKTQVHPRTDKQAGGHIHSRLTHTLEVSCVGRSLGWILGQKLKKDSLMPDNVGVSDLACIVQSACLAHDLGNPPLGHTGENIIRSFFHENERILSPLNDHQKADLLNFEGNAQSLRLVSNLEYRPDLGGMRLTYATIASLIKYPWSSYKAQKEGKSKHNIFSSELDIVRKIFKQMGLLSEIGELKRHPLSFLMEASDDICYALLDLEDGVGMGNLSHEKVERFFLNCLSHEQHSTPPNITSTQRLSILRGRLMHELITFASDKFHRDISEILDGKSIKNLMEDNQILQEAKSIAKEHIYNENHDKQLKSRYTRVLNGWLYELTDLAYSGYQKQDMSDLIARLDHYKLNFWKEPDSADLYPWIMHCLDNISGLTDNEMMNL